MPSKRAPHVRQCRRAGCSRPATHVVGSDTPLSFYCACHNPASAVPITRLNVVTVPDAHDDPTDPAPYVVAVELAEQCPTRAAAARAAERMARRYPGRQVRTYHGEHHVTSLAFLHSGLPKE